MARFPSVRTLYVIEIRDANVSPAAKLVGYTLATYMRPDGCAWPAIPTLAARCNLSDRVVQRAIRELENADLLDVAKRPGRPSTYLATPHPGGDAHVTTKQTFGVTPTSPRGDAHVTPGVTPTSPPRELGLELVQEQDARARAGENGDEAVGYGDPDTAELARVMAREARRRLGAQRSDDRGEGEG